MVAEAPTCEPPWNTEYPVTPVSSLDAFHESVADVGPTALVSRPAGVEGGVESPAHACVATFAEKVLETLPAASNAASPSA